MRKATAANGGGARPRAAAPPHPGLLEFAKTRPSQHHGYCHACAAVPSPLLAEAQTAFNRGLASPSLILYWLTACGIEDLPLRALRSQLENRHDLRRAGEGNANG